MLFCVITTIQRPTPSVIKLADSLSESNGHLVIVGDSKGPPTYELVQVAGFQSEQLSFLDLAAQTDSEFELGKMLPTGHYARKNMGYLHAIANGASFIFETDDDNAPLSSWRSREKLVDSCLLESAVATAKVPWVNIYKHFTGANIWPRGLPLEWIHKPVVTDDESIQRKAPIQQGLVNGSPDVDAIWRLTMDREFCFENRKSVMVRPGSWCPFNTQSTWWWPEAYPLLYVPSYCSFRMCDIWKSFVAQRCIWQLDTGVVFHAPEVYQDRNAHNLTRDFEQEIIGYTKNSEIAEILQEVNLRPGTSEIGQNLRLCYEALTEKGIIHADELVLVDQWLSDVEKALVLAS